MTFTFKTIIAMKKVLQSLIFLLAALMLSGYAGSQCLNAFLKRHSVMSTIVNDKLVGDTAIGVIKTETFRVNCVSFTMVTVKGGKFMMGAAIEQGVGVHDKETPVHQVSLSSYSIGQTEVTQALWLAVMGTNPSFFTSANGYADDLQRPVEKVSWNDCREFLSRLNRMTNRQFRLPTEAEWEYAACGGKLNQGHKYAGSDNISEVAWYKENIPSHSSGTVGYGTQPVASKCPNELGLYDMSGNVWEWCHDRYGRYSKKSQKNPIGPTSGSCRVNRGGSWCDDAGNCRVSFRYDCVPAYLSNDVGLRLAL